MLKFIESSILASKPYLLATKEFALDLAHKLYIYGSTLDFSGIQAALHEVFKSLVG